MVNRLQYQEEFADNVSNGLRMYRVTDLRMKRILHRLHPNTNWDKLNLFTLPTNSALGVEDGREIYECKDLSKWVICYNKIHPTMILAETSCHGRKLVVKCPECQRALGSSDSTKFYSVRYMMACREGHLGDVDWRYEVHRGKAKCEGNVFEWKVSGGNDNVIISCMGHWNGDTFVHSKCGGTVSYIQLRTRSMNGEMRCSAKFAESGDDAKGCGERKWPILGQDG